MLRTTFLMKRSALLLLVFAVLLGAAASAQTQSVLHNFCASAGCTDGNRPYAGLVPDQQGNLYGTTEQGGAQIGDYGTGVVFKLTPGGKETVYTFCAQTDCTDGEWPIAGLVFQKGDLYGTTYYGGSSGLGTVFKLTPEGKETVLYSFCPQGGFFNCTGGQNPWAGVVFDQNGNLYGTALNGGTYNNNCDLGCGVVFKVSPEGNETVLYSFCQQANCTDGAGPYAGVVRDQEGNLYGTTFGGGNNTNNVCDPTGCGAVFKITPEGTETVLYSFCAQNKCSDGANPEAGLVFDQAGNLYGTAVAGGLLNQTYCLGTCGVVFKLTPEGKETVYSFCAQSGCIDGAFPAAGLVLDKGNLYGTTYYGGAYSNQTCSPYISGCGVVFKITPEGKETVLYSFCAQNNCADGALPEAGVILDEKGNIYGTTQNDGADGGGVVFKITP
jgi:uncharacterized repeat protein (TIGR03803 family)